MKTRGKAIILFLIGLFCETEIRVFGSIGISELVIFLIAPFIYLKDLNFIRKQGFSLVIWLDFLVLVGAFVAIYWNHAQFLPSFKGIAQIYSLFAGIVVFRRLLVGNLSGLKYFLFGMAISSVICVFIFQKGVYGAGYFSQKEVFENAITNPIFWINKVKTFALLPIEGWYLSVPSPVSYLTAFCFAIYAILASTSGRSASISSFAAAILLFIGKKSRWKMKSISKHFSLVVILGLCALFLLKTGYTTFASNGMLGADAQKKFENQTQGRTDFLSILIGGRGDSLRGIYFGIKNPIIGYSVYAPDTKRLTEDFIYKYGTRDDYKWFLGNRIYRQQKGLPSRELIAAHSVIFCWWVWFGIFGLLFWIYVFYLMINLFRKWIGVFPPLYGYFCIVTPAMTWAILFSPFSGRMGYAAFITCILLVKAMYERRIPNEWDLQDEYIKQKYQ